jgi:hypothetical protein
MRVKLVSRDTQRCGVSDYGWRLCHVLSRSEKLEVIPVTERYAEVYMPFHADVLIYNYHHATISSSQVEAFKKVYPKSKHIALHHEGPIDATFDKIIEVADLPRPLFNVEHEQFPHAIPVIGSFGFGFGNKGYTRIAEKVKAQFERAILRLHIPSAEFGDNEGTQAADQIQKVTDILGRSGIELQVSTNFMSHDTLLRWLSANDLNIFLYDDMPGRGLSSTIDYALSVKRPIAISNSCMFRHIYKPEIDADINSLQSIIDRGIEPLREAYENNSNQKLIEYFERELCTV